MQKNLREYSDFGGPTQEEYSGGPVLDWSGRGVAIVAEALPLGDGQRLNTAYEVDVKE